MMYLHIDRQSEVAQRTLVGVTSFSYGGASSCVSIGIKDAGRLCTMRAASKDLACLDCSGLTLRLGCKYVAHLRIHPPEIRTVLE